MPEFDELGVSGLKQYAGFIEEAYHTDLRWPSCQPLYSRMRRSDPEVSIVRGVYTSLARRAQFYWELPDDPTPDEKAAGEFAESVLKDIDGGISSFAETMLGNVPFFGWGMWEVLWGLRDPKWSAPAGDDWRSQFDDGRFGIRRLAWRDTSSFDRWEFADNGKVTGMIQFVPGTSERVPLPLDRCLHLTFGDTHNPEGLSPLEALWRLERIKYGLEVIQGIGFEHSAGHLSVTAEEELSRETESMIRKAARAVMMAQEGNYAAWPKGYKGEIIDSNFSAALAILQTIQYWGVLKLTIFNMQWVALSATTGSGSYSAMSDSSSMFMVTFNSMLDGFASQMDNQIGRRLFAYNNFGAIRRPVLKARPIEKVISLGELASILSPLKNVMPLGEEDFKAIRAKTGFLPETLPEKEEAPEPEPAVKEPQPGEPDPDNPDMPAEDAPDPEETAQRIYDQLRRFREMDAETRAQASGILNGAIR
jgi:hypothetical protein